MTLTFMKLIINNFYLWIKKLLLYIYIKKIKFIYKKWNLFFYNKIKLYKN